ncbi:MAG: hypothetical protein AAGJ50_03070 [Pseudomonadota bacterium]
MKMDIVDSQNISIWKVLMQVANCDSVSASPITVQSFSERKSNEETELSFPANAASTCPGQVRSQSSQDIDGGA